MDIIDRVICEALNDEKRDVILYFTSTGVLQYALIVESGVNDKELHNKSCIVISTKKKIVVTDENMKVLHRDEVAKRIMSVGFHVLAYRVKAIGEVAKIKDVKTKILEVELVGRRLYAVLEPHVKKVKKIMWDFDILAILEQKDQVIETLIEIRLGE